MISIYKPNIIKKGWGEERVIVNNLNYCAKILAFNAGKSGSFHFHGTKTETWFVTKGRALIYSFNPETGKEFSNAIVVGDIIHIPALTPHKLVALEDTEIFESSTHHVDDDTYRIGPGDSQK